MGDFLYSQEHLWFLKRSDTIMRLGFSEYLIVPGQPQYLRLPSIGEEFDADSEIGNLETDKCTIAICLPFAGKLIDVNNALFEDLERLHNGDRKEEWICEIELSNPNDLTKLMTEQQYRSFCEP